MSLFLKILNGEIPGFLLHETEFSFSFLTLDQIELGHSLVVPKRVTDLWYECDDESLCDVILHAKKLGPALQRATGCRRVGTATVGFEVPHFHLHLVPMNMISDLDFSKAKQRTGEEIAEIQHKIKTELVQSSD